MKQHESSSSNDSGKRIKKFFEFKTYNEKILEKLEDKITEAHAGYL